MTSHPKIFVSYSHESEAHRERILGLAERLRVDGFETMIDQYVDGTPPQGWPRWMLNQIDWADFIILICTETYYKRFRGHEQQDVGKGADWEGAVITNELYDKKSVSRRFVPVLVERADSRYIPEPLRAFTFYVLTGDDAYPRLTDYLAGAAGVMPASLGPPPDRKRKTGAGLRFDGVAGAQATAAVPGQTGSNPSPFSKKGGTMPADERKQTQHGGDPSNVNQAESDSSTARPVIASLHGIRTSGFWQKEISPTLSASEFIYWPLDYGWFSALLFVLPFMRRRKINWFLDEYTKMRTAHCQADISIICHNFGTYILGHALLLFPEMRFHRVILCGSILPRNFPWESVAQRGQVTEVLNHYGQLDIWAAAAIYIVKDAGDSGAKGFQLSDDQKVLSQIRNPLFGHSSFFYKLNYSECWMPFLEYGRVVQTGIDYRRSWNWRFASVLLGIVILIAMVIVGSIFPSNDISGHVYTSERSPLANFNVSVLQSSNGSNVGKTSRTDANGRFSLRLSGVKGTQIRLRFDGKPPQILDSKIGATDLEIVLP